MARLTEIRATTVSLVDRAAVRDPSNPTEPQRLLLWKSESGPSGQTSYQEEADLEARLFDVNKARNEALAKTERLDARITELQKQAQVRKDELMSTNGNAGSMALSHGTKLPYPAADLAALRAAAAGLANATDGRAVAARSKLLALIDGYGTAQAKMEKAFTIAKAEGVSDLDAMRAASSMPAVLEAQQEIAKLDDQRAGVLLEASGQLRVLRKSEDQVSGLAKAQQKAEELRKSDPGLSRSEAMRQAMGDPDIAGLYADSLASA
jgi:hypothetical protein